MKLKPLYFVPSRSSLILSLSLFVCLFFFLENASYGEDGFSRYFLRGTTFCHFFQLKMAEARVEGLSLDEDNDNPHSARTRTDSLKPRERNDVPVEIDSEGKLKLVYTIPIEGEIHDPQLYILRRGLKEAMDQDIDTVILILNTPGGKLEITLGIMDALNNFKGKIIALIHDEAISAGSYMAMVADEIYFTPQGIMGAAAVIEGTGESIQDTLKLKINSYLQAKMRVLTQGYRYRSSVQRAMMDESFILEIDGKIIKPAGELLTLTANEAIEIYGDPPEPLLAAGIVDSIEDLLDRKWGKDCYGIKSFKITWSEELAKWLNKVTPVLLGLGLMGLFIEFKTPGFGFLGLAGLGLLLLVFASNYIAGLAGYEAVLIFSIGLICLGVEIFVLPGMIVLGLTGIILVIGSLLWGMTDIWPQSSGFSISFELFLKPALTLGLGLIIAVLGIIIFIRFLPKRWFWDRIILQKSIDSRSNKMSYKDEFWGKTAMTATRLVPSGKIIFNGIYYEATSIDGLIESNTEVIIVGKDDFQILVKK